MAGRCFDVDLELSTDRRAVAFVNLAKHSNATAIRAIGVFPDNNETAPCETGDRSIGLLVRRLRIDQKLRADGCPGGVIDLAKHPIAAAIACRPRGRTCPNDDNAATCQTVRASACVDRPDCGQRLVAGRFAVDLNVSSRGHARRVVKADANAVSVAVAGIVRERDRKTATGNGRDFGIELRESDIRLIDLEFIARGQTIRTEALPENAKIERGRNVLVQALPDDDKSAIVGPDDRRVRLRRNLSAVHDERVADLLTRRREALRDDRRP